MGFIYRDDWEESENVQLILFRHNLLTKFNLRNFYNATVKEKNQMFLLINNRIKRVGTTAGQRYNDEEIIEEVIEMKRYLDKYFII